MAASVSAPSSSDDEGIVFPADARGRRSTTEVGRAVFADALRAVNAQAAAACERERNWRARYITHALRLVEEGAQTPTAALSIAREGLESAQRRMRFVRDGSPRALAEAMREPQPGWTTRSVSGVSKVGPAPVTIPYQGKLLTGDTLRRQIDRWEADGIIEPSFAQAIWRVQAHPDWVDLSDQRFALLGALAEMSPLPWLLRWRATVYAVDLPRAEIWQRLTRLAHAGNGSLHAPIAPIAPITPLVDAALEPGADLIRHPSEIAAWLGEIDGPLTIGAYAYLEGAQHVRVAVAMDAIQSALAVRTGTTLAMLATPTDAYAVPSAALDAARARFEARSGALRLARVASFGRAFARNGRALVEANAAVGGIVDALVVQQGPNYILAKRLQHWRALAARAAGTRVSIHVAPPALTGSVVKNNLIASAYRSATRFGVQAFEPGTAAALMAVLLVHDVRHAEAVANPATPLAHPLQLLNDAACHGGLWRMPFAARSALPVAALIGMLAHESLHARSP
jgi:hypothetical protein